MPDGSIRKGVHEINVFIVSKKNGVILPNPSSASSIGTREMYLEMARNNYTKRYFDNADTCNYYIQIAGSEFNSSGFDFEKYVLCPLSYTKYESSEAIIEFQLKGYIDHNSKEVLLYLNTKFEKCYGKLGDIWPHNYRHWIGIPRIPDGYQFKLVTEEN